MKKIKLFLGAYINAQNAQNLNCLSLAEYLDKKKFEIYTMTNSNGNIDISYLKDCSHIFHYNNKFKFTKIWYYIYALYKCDVLYLPKREKLNFINLLNKYIFKKKIFTTVEGVFTDGQIKFFKNNIKKNNLDAYLHQCKTTNNVYSITKFMKAYNKKKLNIDTNETILYLGVDTNKLTKKNIVKKQLTDIVFIGNNMKLKGLDEYLKLSTIFNEINFHLVGKGTGVDFEHIKKEYPNIIVHGSLNPKELNSLLQHIDLHILPSKSEGFPKVILETASVGIPSIVYDTYGAEEWIDNNINGFIINDFKLIVNTIKELLNNNDLLFITSKKSIKLAEKFDWKSIIKIWEKEIITIYEN